MASRTTLTAGYAALALRLQETAAEMTNRDVVSRLTDSLSDHFRGTGKWGYYLDHVGDAESGDVIYSTDGDTCKAPYEISGGDGSAARCVIDHDKKVDVVPRTVYEEEQDEPDHYAAMESATLYSEGAVPLCERFISKAEREKHGDEDFAGKGKSFPIFEPGDIEAAVRSIGRAGSGNLGPSGIKARIVAIAKRRGWEKYLPKAWNTGEARESDTGQKPGTVQLRESVAFEIDIPLREAFASSRHIKLIAPGKGSSAFYPAEVLKRDGPKVFRAGTPMRIDHPTRAEEAARPEGSVRDWGAVLESDAVWLDDHKQGPGLYGTIKPFSDHAGMIEEKGPYAGVSIRANGNAVMEAGRTVMREGVPLLAELTGADGVDMVTRAGAGGMFLSESAHDGAAERMEMTEAEVKSLVESAVQAATSPLKERALRGDAIVAAGRVLVGVSFTEAQKQFVVEQVLRESLPTVEGKLDEKAFGELVMAEARRVGSLLGNGAAVRGLGAAAMTEADKKKAAKKGMKDCPTCDGEGKDGDGEDCEDCGGEGRVARESANPDKALATMLASSLGLSESAAARAAKGRG